VLATYPEELSTKAQRHLEKLGVEVRTNALVTSIEEGAVHVGDEVINAHNVFWAAGVAASPLGASLGAKLDRAGRVLVEKDCSVTGHPEVFVLGDLAHLEQDGHMLPGVCQVAMQMGTHAARTIINDVRQKPRRNFRYFDKGNLATIGRAAAVADIHGLRFGGFLAWIIWVFVHILYLIGFKNRVLVMIQWAWAYVGQRRSNRLITGDVGMHLTKARTVGV
jgi:NADH dehydrogenase